MRMLLLAMTLSCRAGDRDPAAADTLWLDPAGAQSAITASTSEAELIQRFGATHVRRAEISLAEGEVADGTMLFPDDSTRRMEIVWRDSAARARPDFVRVGGGSSRWMVTPGVRLGTTVAELERMNGGPFVLSGADPNTGAFIVLSWKGGRLEGLSKGAARVWIQLNAPETGATTSAEPDAEPNEREHASDDPLVRSLNLRVDEITLGFGVEDDAAAVQPPAADSVVAFSGALRIEKRTFTERNRPGRSPDYEITATYPELVGSSAAGVVAFNRAMRALVDSLVVMMRTGATGPDAVGGEQHVDYALELANDDLVSVHFTDYFRYEGAGQSNAISHTMTWDLRRGRRLRFDELFTPGTPLDRLIADHAMRELKRIFAEEEWATDERLARSVEHVVGDDDRWLVGRRALVLVFDSAEIGPPGAGATTVEIPYSILAPFIRPDGPLATRIR